MVPSVSMCYPALRQDGGLMLDWLTRVHGGLWRDMYFVFPLKT